MKTASKRSEPLDNPKDRLNLVLLEGARLGDLTAVQATLQQGAEASSTDHWGRTALHWAATMNHTECCSFLLNHCNPNQVNLDGNTALHLATSRDSLSAVRLLLPHTDVNLQDSSGHTPLMVAASHGHTECLLNLLPYSDLHLRDKFDLSPRQLANISSHSNCVALIDAFILAQAEQQELGTLLPKHSTTVPLKRI